MLEDNQTQVVNTCREACKKHHDGELKYYKTMAIYVKEQLDRKLGGSWHICVGKLHFQFLINHFPSIGTNFGSFVTYEAKNIYMFWLEHICFLIWKHG